jgi:hypothetical protein
LTKIEATVRPASVRPWAISDRWPLCSAPMVGTRTTGREAFFREARADATVLAIFTAALLGKGA